MKEIIVKSIGIIRTPYKTHKGMPIQGKFKPGVKGKAVLFKKYAKGLKDLEGFSHAIFLWYVHKSKEERLLSKPFMEEVIHGVFATRSPHRPNHIGFSIVKIERVKGSIVTFSKVDMLDRTPLLDIKPFMGQVDSRKNVRTGWAQKHLKKRKLPKHAIHR